MKYINKLAIAICAGIAIQSACAQQSVVNGAFEANGNSGYFQGTPTGWTEGAGTGNYIVGGGSSSPFVNAYPTGDKAEFLLDGYAPLYQTFGTTTASQVNFNFDLLNTDNTKVGRYYLYFDGWTGGSGASALFQIGNSLTVSGGVLDNTVIGTLASYGWYNVRGTFDYTAGTFSGGVYTIAGGATPVATFSDTLRTTGATGVDRIYITDGSGYVNPAIYVDNFSITPVPEPSTMALAALGGCAVLLLGRKRQ